MREMWDLEVVVSIANFAPHRPSLIAIIRVVTPAYSQPVIKSRISDLQHGLVTASTAYQTGGAVPGGADIRGDTA